ncbi:MAG: 3-hydroxyacyl-CoA dehydrogenase family protein [Parachlamydiaceae bacterium]|nr:3-hydroxyacyl-CoA dehydrogenase family protein [Parachlamydiaceae bacterium]
MMQGLGKDGMQQVAVLGAAGKMGSGIALLILQQFAKLTCSVKENQVSPYRLILIDANEAGFAMLKRYLQDQLKKYAERNINELRALYKKRADLIDNSEMINAFVEEAFECVSLVTMLEECRGAQLVFEAIVEDIDIKIEVFAKLNKLLGPNCYFFSNTSSIPIHTLQERSDLQGRLIGFHFYNPPAVQRLLELIIPENTPQPLISLAEEIGEQLKKTVVHSKDVAGFIGNGHFIREVHFACEQVHALTKNMPLIEAIVLINRMTQEFLLRPMGIFQLIDYVGIEVVQRIAKIMSTYLHQTFGNELIDRMVEQKICGGQFGDGSQKDGFFHYEKGVPVEIYDRVSKKYTSCNGLDFRKKIDDWFGGKPPLGVSWTLLSKDPQGKEKIAEYWKHLLRDETKGANLAKEFRAESRKIAEDLVADRIAGSIKDVDTVLMNGFLHL